jgi:hypothetical protein
VGDYIFFRYVEIWSSEVDGRNSGRMDKKKFLSFLLPLVIATILSRLAVLIFEDPTRPFAAWQILLLYFLCCFPAKGIVMLFDPRAKTAKAEFLKINFYEDKRACK